jgi:hypothetical protein
MPAGVGEAPARSVHVVVVAGVGPADVTDDDHGSAGSAADREGYARPGDERPLSGVAGLDTAGC